MKKNSTIRTAAIGLLLYLVFCGDGLAGQPLPEADRLVGVWLTESEDQIEIRQEVGKYFGKPVAVHGKEDRLDTKNPDARLRNRRLTDVTILKDFEYLGENRWGKGTIYDPNNGKTYRCTITMKSEDQIKVRGFIGVSLLGRTEVWPRVKEN